MHVTDYAMTFGGTHCQTAISATPEIVLTRQCKTLLAGMQTMRERLAPNARSHFALPPRLLDSNTERLSLLKRRGCLLQVSGYGTSFGCLQIQRRLTVVPVGQAGRERLAPNVRSQVAVLPKKLSDTQTDVELVLLSKGSMKNEHRKAILDGAMKTKDMSNEHFLQTVQSRLARPLPYTLPLQAPCAQTDPLTNTRSIDSS